MESENVHSSTHSTTTTPPKLRVKVERATNLMGNGRRKMTKAFAVLWIDPTVKKSTPMNTNSRWRFAEWDHEILFDMEEDRDLPPYSTITIEVWSVIVQAGTPVYTLVGVTYFSLARLASIKARINPALQDTVVLGLRPPATYQELGQFPEFGSITLAISYTSEISQRWGTSCLARLLPGQRGPVKGFPVGNNFYPPAPYSEHDIPLGSRSELEVHFQAAQSTAGHGPNHPFSTYYLCTHWKCSCRSHFENACRSTLSLTF